MIDLSRIDFYGRHSFHSKTIELKYGLKELSGPDAVSKSVRYMVGSGHEHDFLVKLFAGAEKKILHWIGTDVMYAVEESKKNGRHPVYDDVIHFCDWYNLREELASIGINAEVVIHEPWNMPDSVMPLGDEVMVYVSELRADFFRFDLMKQCEAEYRKLTGKDFVWIGTANNDADAMRNIDVKSQMARCRTLIRAPIHDGCSHTVLEMLLAGRTVLNAMPMPYCEHIEPTVESIMSKIFAAPHPEAPYFYRTLLRDRGLIPALARHLQ